VELVRLNSTYGVAEVARMQRSLGRIATVARVSPADTATAVSTIAPRGAKALAILTGASQATRSAGYADQ
jgi:hypothetical protein